MHDEGRWRAADELLTASQYERLAELLREAQAAIERRGDAIPAHVLVLARRICLACSQSQAESKWHQQACGEAVQREEKLRQQLCTLLDLVSERDLAEVPCTWEAMPRVRPVEIGPPAPGLPVPVERLSLWQRIQGALGWRLGPRPASTLVHEATSGDITPPSSEGLQVLVSLSTETTEGQVEAAAEAPEMPALLATEEIAEPATHPTDEAEAPVPPLLEEEEPLASPRSEETDLSTPRLVEEAGDPVVSVPEEAEVPVLSPAEQTETVLPPHRDVEVPATPVIKIAEPSLPLRTRQPEVSTESTNEGPTLPPSSSPDAAEMPILHAVADEEKRGPPSLVVHCLGSFRVYQDDEPVEDWPSSKGKAIFKYLVTHWKRPTPKEVLMELFWPGAHPDAARNNLNVAIYGLRQALRQARPAFFHVLFRDDCYLLNPDLQVWVDVEDFWEHCRIAHDLEEQGDLPAAMREYRAAEALYQGEFLEEDRYIDWPTPLRQTVRDSFLSLLEHLSRYYLDQKDHAACVTVCRKMLTVDACCEEAHRRLMRCYSRLGQHFLALRQYHLCVETLQEELDVAPAPFTTQLYELIRRRQHV